ncbi:MAG: hypothetical protein ABH969_02355 [Pseudomonadota bacterium]
MNNQSAWSVKIVKNVEIVDVLTKHRGRNESKGNNGRNDLNDHDSSAIICFQIKIPSARHYNLNSPEREKFSKRENVDTGFILT